MINAHSHITTTVYDARSSVLAVQDPLGKFVSYTYDPAMNKILRIDSRNWPTTYSFDALNRQSGYIYNSGQRATFTYNHLSLQTGMADWTGLTTMTYDSDERPAGIAYPTGKAVTYSYDPNGNELSRWQVNAAGTALAAYTATYDPARNRLTWWNSGMITTDYYLCI